MKLVDKVAIVTGAAQGIGQGYAETLAREGAKVAVVDLKGEQAERVAAAIADTGGEAIGIQADVSDPNSVEEMCRKTAEQFGGIDFVVNNAAIYEGYVHYSLLEVPLDYWQRFLDVNLTSVLICTQAALPYMIERGGGKIVNQSSDGADSSGNQYGVTKLGVQGLTVGFARNLGKHNITVNCLSPGVINTKATMDLHPDAEQMAANWNAITRIGTPEDMAGALVYLLSPEADWVTGQILRVNGGFVMHPA